MDATVIDAADMDATEIVAFVRTVPIFQTPVEGSATADRGGSRGSRM